MSSLNPVFPFLTTYSSVGVSVYRISDGKTYDFATTGSTPQQFTSSTPTTKLFAFSQDPNNPQAWVGPIPTTGLLAQFTDGWYICYAYNTTGSPVLVAWTAPFYVASGNDLGAPSSGGSGGGTDLPSGTVVAGSTGTAVIVSGVPTGKTFVGQTLRHEPSQERRQIVSQTFANSNYTFTVGGGSGLLAAFTSVTAGDQITVI